MSDLIQNPSRHFAVGTALLVVIGSLLLFPGLGRITIQREQELRVVLSARHMAVGGSWIIPEFLNQPRIRKPPLMYWLVATTYLLAGTTSSAAVARVPGALAGIALLVTIYLLGARLIGRRRAFFSALACATSFLFIRHARLMETDITLTLFVMLSTVFGYFALTRKDHALRWWTLAGLTGGIGFMTKGPAALAIPALTWLAFAAQRPRRLKQLCTRQFVVGVVLFAAVAFPWYIAIYSMMRGESALHSQITNELSQTFAEADHPGPFFFYVYTLLQALLPWSLVFPFALWSCIRQRHRQAVRFLLTWFAVAFVALSLIANKQIHYCTLLLPQSALMIGLFAAPPLYRSALRRYRLLGKAFVAVVAILAGAGVGLAVAPWLGAHLPREQCLVTGTVLLGLGILVAVARHPRFAPCVAFPLQVATAVGCFAMLIHPLQNASSMIPQFMQAAQPKLAAARTVYVVGPHAAMLEFYAGRAVTPAPSLSNAWAQATSGDAILASGNKRRPVPEKELPAPPRMDMSRDDLRCVLLLKSEGGPI